MSLEFVFYALTDLIKIQTVTENINSHQNQSKSQLKSSPFFVSDYQLDIKQNLLHIREYSSIWYFKKNNFDGF